MLSGKGVRDESNYQIEAWRCDECLHGHDTQRNNQPNRRVKRNDKSDEPNTADELKLVGY